MKSAQVYIGIVEKAAGSRSARATSKLLADESKFYRTTMSRDEAEKDAERDLKKWSEMDLRLVRCDTEASGQNGSFECDAVMTRTKAGTQSHEVSTFRVRYAYEAYKYVVWGEPVRIQRKWSPL